VGFVVMIGVGGTNSWGNWGIQLGGLLQARSYFVVRQRMRFLWRNLIRVLGCRMGNLDKQLGAHLRAIEQLGKQRLQPKQLIG